MKNKQILAIFDFCDTLIGMQTANRFISLCYKENKNLTTIFNEVCLSAKKVEAIAKQYVKNELLPKQNMTVVERMLWHKRQGHKIAIVSGGFSQYIKEYAKNYSIDFVIATELELRDGIFTGNILGNDCMGKNKITKIKQHLKLDDFDLDHSYAYSDHISDIPLLNFTGHGVVVNFGQDISWAIKAGYEIINAK